MHDHHHHHQPEELSDLNTRFMFGIILNILFVIFEAILGFYFDSLALLSDSAHNLSDVASLLLALFAFRLAKIKPDVKYTYGYRKTTILVSLVNAIILVFAMGAIIYESIHRIKVMNSVDGNPIAIVAAIGIIINSLTAWLFLRDKEKDLNVKGAYLHMIADALVSFGVLIAGILISVTSWYWLDGAISIGIACFVLYSSIDLLRKSFHLSIDAVPEGIDMVILKGEIEKVDGVLEVHHIHVWAISTTLTAFTGHVRVKKNTDIEDLLRIKQSIRHILAHANIHHSTIEFETFDEYCEEGETNV
ncbi:MAG TPA: cation diffusion facilitator family transporter [Leptospiraceae bacterium]|nr:cation diffusion facilitator family transporter [Leptospiraceae bacterium]HMW05452.1 cation diffusion facilitator family transporter [Leptospiraceae bacterium]HMX31399.1 cation diffusion facilitator family transporter [Leptospiraceae bacterium]HMY30962.1 cation diffusion facilitator family transporter [Leptospiraceae bacterium]HMZ63373.1 cation diffusion facilitator family transporter [Leptospiraceae bacterium]